ncbi:MAG: VCBS repeat-containing protein, partial [Cyclobacteriaceae bacterium]|nr:VCBS repeat-containing protein [Cyclobacteriaceae bacterium]
EENSIKSMIDMMPSEPISNYVFINNGDLTFTNKAEDWGMHVPTFSNGSAYSDLDNDGDLDVVVNNVNMVSTIYENKTNQIFPDRNFLHLKLTGIQPNTMAIGAKIKLFSDEQIYYQEQNPMRGFESSVDHKLVVGLGDIEKIDSLEITWPSDRVTTLYNVDVNKVIKRSEKDGVFRSIENREELQQPAILSSYKNPQLEFVHKENDYNDFHKDRLLFHMNSTEGPCICKADVNNDGMEDIYIGGASGQPGKLFIQGNNGDFNSSVESFEKDARSEDLDCVFFDANGDGNPDLYVTSGGSEFSSFTLWLNDRLYFGDGQGRFTKTSQRLPLKGFESTSTVVPLDIDDDGDLDLFVGGRSVP